MSQLFNGEVGEVLEMRGQRFFLKNDVLGWIGTQWRDWVNKLHINCEKYSPF